MAIKHSFHFTSTTDIVIEGTGNTYYPFSLAFDGEAVTDDGFTTRLRAGMAMTREEATLVRDQLSDLLDQPTAGVREDTGCMFFELTPEYLSRLAEASGWQVAPDGDPYANSSPLEGGFRIDPSLLNEALRMVGLKLVVMN